MKAFDTYSGTGWGLGCQRVGIHEVGCDNMPAVLSTRAANGMRTPYQDVWDTMGLKSKSYDIKISSPPCQTFSPTGTGTGRRALDTMLDLIDSGIYRSPRRIRKFGENHDPRTALTLTPLFHVWRDMPEFVVFELVPTVLPVWERMAAELRSWGYHTYVSKMKMENYGVPQTRTRAVLIARYGADPTLPQESRLVSMGSYLGWPKSWRNEWIQRSNYSDGRTGRGLRTAQQQSFTITGKPPSWIPADTVDVVGTPGTRLPPWQAGALQTYPEEFDWRGSLSDQYQQIGNAVPPLFAEQVLRSLIS